MTQRLEDDNRQLSFTVKRQNSMMAALQGKVDIQQDMLEAQQACISELEGRLEGVDSHLARLEFPIRGK